MKIIKTPILIFEERMHHTFMLLFCFTVFCWQFAFTNLGLLTLSVGSFCLFVPFFHFLFLIIFVYRKPTFVLKAGGWLEETQIDFAFYDYLYTVLLLAYFYGLKYFFSEPHYMLFSVGSFLLLFLAIFILGIYDYLKSEYDPESKVLRVMFFDSKVVFFKRYFITEFDLKNVDKIEISDNFVEIWSSLGLLQKFDCINFDDYDMKKLIAFCEKSNNKLSP